MESSEDLKKDIRDIDKETELKIIEGIHTLEFYLKNKKLYRDIEDTLGENVGCKMLQDISKNMDLFTKIKESGCKNYTHIKPALKRLQKLQQTSSDHVLIYFADFEIYSLFSLNTYCAFWRKLQKSFAAQKNIKLTPYQIVLPGMSQKLVFICRGNNDIIEKLEAFLNKKYMTNECVHENCADYKKNCLELSHRQKVLVRDFEDNKEITIPGLVGKSFDEVQMLYFEICDYIKQYDKVIAKSISHKQIMYKYKTKYTISNVTYELTDCAAGYDEVINALCSHHGKNITFNITNKKYKITNTGDNNIINNVIGNNNNTGNTKIQSAEDIEKQAKEWIRNNLPPTQIIRDEYHKKYKADHPNGLPIGLFGKLAKKAGLKSKSTNGKRYYYF